MEQSIRLSSNEGGTRLGNRSVILDGSLKNPQSNQLNSKELLLKEKKPPRFFAHTHTQIEGGEDCQKKLLLQKTTPTVCLHAPEQQNRSTHSLYEIGSVR
jgi:hypothetical protein